MRQDRLQVTPVRYRLVEVEGGARLDLSVSIEIPDRMIDKGSDELWANVQRVLTKAIYTRAQRKATDHERGSEPESEPAAS
jgi:hypothetical protein